MRHYLAVAALVLALPVAAQERDQVIRDQVAPAGAGITPLAHVIIPHGQVRDQVRGQVRIQVLDQVITPDQVVTPDQVRQPEH